MYQYQQMAMNYTTVPQERYQTFAMAQPVAPPRSFAAPEPVVTAAAAPSAPKNEIQSGTRDGVHHHISPQDRVAFREQLAAAAEARIQPPAAHIPGQQLTGGATK